MKVFDIIDNGTAAFIDSKLKKRNLQCKLSGSSDASGVYFFKLFTADWNDKVNDFNKIKIYRLSGFRKGVKTL